MESKGKNNVEKNSDENINKKAKAHDLLKRVGKTVSWGGLGVLSVAGVALGIGSASLVGYAIAATCVPIYAFSSTRAIVNVIYKTEPDLLFMIKSSKGKKEISQDTRFLEIYKNLRRYKTRKKEILKSLDEGIIEKKFNSSKEKEEYVDKKISAETNQRIAGLMTLQTLVGFQE